MNTQNAKPGDKIIAKIILDPLTYDSKVKLREVRRQIHVVSTPAGLVTGWFKLNGCTRYCVSAQGSYVWYQVGGTFPAFRTANPILCPYHQDSLTWDDCTSGFVGCQVEQARLKA